MSVCVCVWVCVCVCVDHLKRCKTSNFLDDLLPWFSFVDFVFRFSIACPTTAGGWSVLQMSPSNEDASVAQ